MASSAAERDRFLGELERVLQPIEDPDEIMSTVARMVGEHLACDRCAYAEAEEDEDHFTMTGSYARGLPPLVGRMAMSDFSAETLRCMRAGEPYVLADAADDPRVLPDQLPIYRRTSIAAVICVPLHKAGRFVAAMAVHHATPRKWTSDEVDLLLTVVNRCWESLQRVHAQGSARAEEERYRDLVLRASDGIWLVDDRTRFVEVNPAACELSGYPRDEHLALTVADLAPAADGSHLEHLLAALGRGGSVTETWELHRRDGGVVSVEMSLRSAGRGRLQAVGRDITERLHAEAERERLLARERAANRLLHLLQGATAALSAAATPERVATIAVARLQELLDTDSVAVWELRDGVLTALAVQDRSAGLRWQRVPLDTDGPVQTAARDGRVSWPGALREAPAGSSREYGPPGLACLPLLVAGQCVGVVAVAFPGPTPGPVRRAAAETLVEQCAQALHRAGLLVAERAARRAAEEFGEVVAALAEATRPREVVAVVLDHADGLGASAAAAVLRRGNRLDLAGARGPAATDPQVALPTSTAADHPLAHAVRTGRPVWDRTPVALPLVVSGRTLGAVGLWFDEGGAPAVDRGRMLTAVGQCAQALDRARLHQAEHEVADVLQRSLLPAGLPPVARLAAAARYTPAAQHTRSGGDWYDMLPVGPTTMALVVGDVVGHGPGAAAVMGQLRSVLASQLLDGRSPADALERLDRFAARVEGSIGSTCACLVYDWSTGELRWALAGHPPVLIVDADGARFLEGGRGTVLGVEGRPPYAEARTVVRPGSSLVLYTDGLVERRDEPLDRGLGRLLDAAGQRATDAPDALVEGLVRACIDEAGADDDVAVLAVRAVPPPLVERLPAQPGSMRRVRRLVAGWAQQAGVPAESVEDLDLALGEAAANAAEHAYRGGPGEFDFEVAREDDGGLRVRVQDEGRWRPPPTDNGFRGHGLGVIESIAHDVRIDRSAGGTCVRFRLPAAERAPDPVRRSAASPPERPERQATAHQEDGRLVLTGDLDSVGREEVGPVVLAAAGRAEPLVVDLTAVPYLSSAGVALLAEAAARCDLSVVVEAGSGPARLLAVTGLGTGFPVTTCRLAGAP